MEFSLVDGKDIWTNKRVFGALSEENRLRTMEMLSNIHVDRIAAFDAKPIEFEEWNFKDELVLVIMPQTRISDTSGKDTRQALKADGLKIKEIYYPMDIYTEEICLNSRYMIYMKTRNLILCKVNIFADKEIFEIAIQDFMLRVKPTDIKRLTDEEKLIEKLSEQWKLNLDDRKDNLNQEIANHKRHMLSMQNDLATTSRNMFVAERSLATLYEMQKDFQAYIDRNIEEMKSFPAIKSLEIKDRVYVSFGPIYINGIVQTGIIEEQGIKKPKMENKRIYIGNLRFAIYGEKVRVTNTDNQIDGCFEHPHARNGDICFGKSDTEAYSYITNVEYGKLVRLLYSWAISYNDGDAHCKLQKFYEVEQAKARGITLAAQQQELAIVEDEEEGEEEDGEE